jgi:plasmid stability protein
VTNVTLSIDEEVLKRARIRALEQGTSVNAVVREFLESYAGNHERTATLRRFLDLAESAQAGREGEGRAWKREDLYQDRTSWPPS